ncbi:hypothetical protein F5146DRAFT_1012207, partial [Armillaria mellea]
MPGFRRKTTSNSLQATLLMLLCILSLPQRMLPLSLPPHRHRTQFQSLPSKIPIRRTLYLSMTARSPAPAPAERPEVQNEDSGKDELELPPTPVPSPTTPLAAEEKQAHTAGRRV